MIEKGIFPDKVVKLKKIKKLSKTIFLMNRIKKKLGKIFVL